MIKEQVHATPIDYVIRTPKYSKWKCELFWTGSSIILHPEEGKEPNWFWRKMQYILLGNKWIKND